MSRPSYLNHSPKRLLLASLVAVLVLVIAGHALLFTPAYGAQLGGRVLQLSNDEISATSDYQVEFNLSTAGQLGSVQVQFCSNDPFPATPCTAPVGFDDSAAVLADQSGPGDFSLLSGATPNELVLSRTPSSVGLSTLRFHLTGIINPSAPGSYYARFQTFATDNASGSASDYGGVAFAITNALAINAEVPPYLIFCTGVTISGLNCANAVGDYVDFGELSSSHVSSGSSQMLVATNAESGYNITVSGTTMTSGTNVIDAMTTNNVSRPGVSQFGFNLRANSTPPDGDDPTGPGVSNPEPNYDQPNSYRFDSGDTLVNNPVPDNVRQYTASYIVNVPVGQAPGVYVSTLTYICLADF